MTTDLIKGRTLGEAKKVTAADISKALGGLPEHITLQRFGS